MMGTPILSLTLDQLKAHFREMGESEYRAKQIFSWLYQKNISSFLEMKNLSLNLRHEFQERFFITEPKVKTFLSSDGTRKFIFTLSDGQAIEAVWIPEVKRKTLCISSQVGCPLRCAFCVTGAVGFKRNLSVDEIVAQVRYVKILQGFPVTNIVFMGMGEPLLNMENVISAIKILCAHDGLKVAKRKITVSTVGVIPKIRPFLAATDVKLAISLTGSTDSSRDYWMPINKTFNLQELTESLKGIPLEKGRKFTFEVVLIANETDTDAQAIKLANLLKKIPSKVNLIPYNENPLFPELKAPSKDRIEAFRTVLMERSIYTTVRKNRGADIMAACGQLAGGSFINIAATEGRAA